MANRQAKGIQPRMLTWHQSVDLAKGCAPLQRRGGTASLTWQTMIRQKMHIKHFWSQLVKEFIRILSKTPHYDKNKVI